MAAMSQEQFERIRKALLGSSTDPSFAETVDAALKKTYPEAWAEYERNHPVPEDAYGEPVEEQLIYCRWNLLDSYVDYTDKKLGYREDQISKIQKDWFGEKGWVHRDDQRQRLFMISPTESQEIYKGDAQHKADVVRRLRAHRNLERRKR
jgi:hypothetical protein